MKLDKLKGLFRAKRIIALALAAAMTVTSLPQTAYAAEAGAPETETAVEVQEDEQPAEAAEEAEVEESVSSTTQAVETEAKEAADEITDAPETTENNTQEAKEADAQEAENQADGDATPAAVTYTFDYDELEKAADEVKIKEYYNGNTPFTSGGNTPNNNILSKIKIKGSDESENSLSSCLSSFTYKWQKKGADSKAEDTDPVLIPENAGEYQLVITPKADDETYKDVKPLTISGFVINKADLKIDSINNGAAIVITPGTAPDKVSDSIKSISVSGGGRTFTYNSENEKNELKLSVEVIDPYTGVKTADTYLKKNSDYKAKITVEFSDAKDAEGNALVSDAEKGNYNLPPTDTKNLTVDDLKETTTKLDNVTDAKDAERSDNGEKVKVITKAYDGNAAGVPAYKVAVEETAPVLDKDGEPVLNTDKTEKHNPVDYTDSDISGKWHSAEFRLWTETEEVARKNADGDTVTEKDADGNEQIVYDIVEKTLCSLTVGGELEDGKAPTEAGAYVYRVTYAGNKEQYAGSYADIVVEITPVEVAVVPQAAEGATFYAGQTVKSVLSQISWKLDKTINAENIWGTSYDNVYKTQPYEPVFAVYRMKDNVAESSPMSDTDKITKAEGVTYEVRFTGKKAVRYENGTIGDNKDINDASVDSFNSNYKTSTDETKNTLPLTLSTKEVKIDVTPLTSDAALAAAGLKKSAVTIDGNAIYTRVYDENKGLFEKRADYKTATANGSGEHLTYKWYRWTNSRDINETQVEVFNEEWDFKSTSNWYALPINYDDFIFNQNSLKNAGIYKLEITYDDGTAYAQENVYYAIEQQQLRYVPTNTLPTARFGAKTEDYIALMTNDSNFSPKLQIRPNNTGDWADLTGWINGIDYLLYDDDWYVEAKAPTPAKDDETPEWEGWQEKYSFDLRTGEEGQTVAQNNYRLVNESDIEISSNYTLCEYKAQEVKTDKETEKKTMKLITENLSVKDIDVKEAGTKKIKIKPLEKEITAEKPYDGKAITVDLSGIKVLDEDEKEVSVALQYVWEWDNGDNTVTVTPEEAVNGGEYYIYAYYPGDADYAPMERTQQAVATATIKQLELTVSVKQPLAENVLAKAVAGNYANDIYSDYTENRASGDMLTVSGFIAEDEDAFTKWVQIGRNDDGDLTYNYPAWTEIYIGEEGIDYEYYQPELCIRSGKEDYYGKLKGGEAYTLNVDENSGELASPYCYNYMLKAGTPVEITAAYASSTTALYILASNELTAADKVSKGDAEKFVHDITFRESIPYASAQVTQEDGTNKQIYGSWAEVRIYIPKEFDNVPSDTAAYENALKNAGAISVNTNSDSKGSYISAVFNLSKDGENGLEPNPVTFSILWKQGFVEKFTITPTEDNLAADLRKAVAPKSVAFNAPKTKMVVGEVQDLDVKITKVQNEDLVYLDYRIADGAPTDVLAVSSQGRITALKAGTTTVEVYPVKIANNSKVQITTVKPAQAKIVVSEVAAPKVGTVTPADESVKVEYPYVKNNGKYYDYGYRREAYVIAGNGKTVTDFDAAIAKFEQTGNYKAAGLATAPVYISNDAEKTIADELARGVYTEYSYNDNIAGFAKGKNVTIQVKIGGLTPKTDYTVYVRNVSAQRTVLDKDGNQKTAQLSANGTLKGFKTTLGQVKLLQVKVDETEDSAKPALLRVYDAEEGETVSALVRYYEYDLASAGTQLVAWGAFSAIEAEDTEKAEAVDYSANYYRLPLTDAALKTKLLDPKLEYRMYQVIQGSDGRWEYATHDYYDENEGDWYDEENYRDNGDINCLYAAEYTKVDKKGALKFAQPEALAITAYDTVTKTESAPIIVRIKAEADSATGKKVTLQVGQTTPIVELLAYKAGNTALASSNPYFAHEATATGNDFFKVENGLITPVKFDKTSAKQTVTVTGTPAGGTADVTIKELEPVKNLKFNNLIDNSFVLDFAPSIYAEGYIVDIRNATGSLVQRKYISQYDKDLDHNDGFIWYYSAKKKAYVLVDEDYKARFRVEGLKARCKYNVTVTAVYGDATSKPVSKAITTSKIPAYDTGLKADAMNDGMGIGVFANGRISGSITNYTFVSGNRYTLVADANQGSAYAVTDKLTWSSSDGKVAKVAAVGGTYSASIKALKAGTTVIEVKSGILKQTIARWKITVRSVGDAYNNAYFYDEDEALRPGDGTGRYDTEAQLVLNVPAAVELVAGERRTFTFVAEEAGSYKVVKSAGMSATVTPDSYETFNLLKGGTQTVTVIAWDEPASGTITVEKVPGTDKNERTPLKLNETVTVSGRYAVFTAPEDGLYRFKGNNSMQLSKNINQFTGNSESTIDYALKKNATIYVKSSGENKIKVTPIAMASLKTEETNSVKNDGTYWYTFTASEGGDYRFKGDSINISVYKKIDDINNNNATSSTVTLKAKDTVYVKANANAWSDTSSFKVTKVEPVVITDDVNEYTDKVEANDTTSFSITPKTDAVYTFTLNNSVNKMSLELSDGTVVKSNTWTNAISYPLKAGTAYSLKVDNSGYSIPRTLTVEKAQISELALNDTEGKKFTMSNTGGGYGYLAFTVPADGEGTYKFEASSSVYLYIMAEPSDNTNEYIVRGSTPVECYLSAGKKVWLQTSASNSNVTVTVKKAGAALQSLPTDGKVTVPAGQTAWYTYKITESGRYSFSNGTCYEDMDKQTNTSSERYWKSGSTVYLKVTNNGTTNVERTITVTKTNTEAWTDISASQTIPGGETKWYAFTAADEGEIKFEAKTESGSTSSINLYTAKQFEAEDSLSTSFSGIYPFAKGETVYLKVQNDNSNDVTLTAEKAELPEIEEGENTVEIEDSSALVKFTAPTTGIYVFAPSKDNADTAYLFLYADRELFVNNKISQSAYSNASLCYPLIKGATVYVRISNYGGSEFGFTVSRDEEVEMTEVTLGKEASLSLTANEKKWIYFKVADTEVSQYRITASADSDNTLYCYYAYYLTSNNWKDSMWASGFSVNSNYNGYTTISSNTDNQVMYMYIQPNNDGDVKITINEHND